MPAKLTARAVAAAKPGRHGDGAGLWLEVSPAGNRRWVYRFSFGKRVTEMSLGSAATMTLAEARIAANDARKLVAAGVNPIEERRKAKAPPSTPTFGECALALIASKESGWRNAKHRAQWRMTLATYAKPLWDRPVDFIDVAGVLECLQPIWQAKPETASRLRGRIEAVLDSARVKGLRSGDNPARWKGNLDHILPRAKKLSRGHHAAMHYAEVPAFIARLRRRESIAALALEFLILTAARSGEVLGARWGEIDLAARVWAVPRERMKAEREHRVPLSEPALAIQKRLAAAKTGEFIFPGRRPGKPLSSMALEMVLRRMKVDGATVHGFRSGLRDWAGDCTHFPREVAEAALAHAAGDQTERAYRRSDALGKRRELMAAWGDYLELGADKKIASTNS
jgi:integrase